jgi:hypothetical protein
MDSEEVLDSKLDLVAALVAASESMIVYTGAGLSKSSGIPDYATKSESSVVQVLFLLYPTLTSTRLQSSRIIWTQSLLTLIVL